MAQAGKKQAIPLRDMHFYFDGVERDRMDSSGWSRRTAEILALRERLLQLDAPTFDATMKTLKGVVQGGGTEDKSQHENRRQAVKTLYDQLPRGHASGAASSAPKVAPA